MANTESEHGTGHKRPHWRVSSMSPTNEPTPLPTEGSQRPRSGHSARDQRQLQNEHPPRVHKRAPPTPRGSGLPDHPLAHPLPSYPSRTATTHPLALARPSNPPLLSPPPPPPSAAWPSRTGCSGQTLAQTGWTRPRAPTPETPTACGQTRRPATRPSCCCQRGCRSPPSAAAASVPTTWWAAVAATSTGGCAGRVGTGGRR